MTQVYFLKVKGLGIGNGWMSPVNQVRPEIRCFFENLAVNYFAFSAFFLRTNFWMSIKAWGLTRGNTPTISTTMDFWTGSSFWPSPRLKTIWWPRWGIHSLDVHGFRCLWLNCSPTDRKGRMVRFLDGLGLPASFHFGVPELQVEKNNFVTVYSVQNYQIWWQTLLIWSLFPEALCTTWRTASINTTRWTFGSGCKNQRRGKLWISAIGSK